MDKPSAEAAFSLKRTSDGSPVAGTFGWDGATDSSSPRRPHWRRTPQYTASVAGTAKDLGTHIGQPDYLALYDRLTPVRATWPPRVPGKAPWKFF